MITTITIIEDDSTFAGLIKQIISSTNNFACTSIYPNAEKALQEFPESPTDIILMDIQLPDESGINLTKHFNKLYPETHIIMCTSFDDDDKIFNSLKAGASGYLVKSDSPDKIIESIGEVLKGGAPMSMGIAKKVIQYFQQKEQERTKIENLTPKENELIEHLSKGLFYKEIAEIMNVGIDTIKKHCGNIYKKLSVSNRTEAINIFLNRQ